MTQPRPVPKPKPIGFDLDEPEYEYHGESMHPDAVQFQCMCGHPDYWECQWERYDADEANGKAQA